MAVWTNPTTRVAEELISQSIWNTDLVENLKYLYDYLFNGQRPSCRVFRTTAQSITLNTDTPISFDSEIFDTDTMFDVSDPTKIVIKTAGKYMVGGCVDWQLGVGTVPRSLWIKINGGNTIVKQLQPNESSTGDNILNVTTLYAFAVGDYIELYVRTPATLNVDTVASYSPIFWATRVGG